MSQSSLFDAPRQPGEIRCCDPWPDGEPWPGTLPAEHGFKPENVKRAKALLLDAAKVLIGDRPDAPFLLPKLVTCFNVEVNDFVRYNRMDASEGFASPKERQQFVESLTAGMHSWDAQVQERTDGDTEHA